MLFVLPGAIGSTNIASLLALWFHFKDKVSCILYLSLVCGNLPLGFITWPVIVNSFGIT